MSTFEGLLSREQPRGVVRRQERRFMIAGLLLADSFVVLVSFAIAYAARFWLDLPFFAEGGAIKPDFYVSIILLLVPGYLGLFQIYGLYSPANLLGGAAEYERWFNAATIGTLMVVVISFLAPSFVIARGWLILSWVLIVLLGMLVRLLIRRTVYALRNSGHFVERTLVVGANPEGLAVAEQLRQAQNSGAHIIGFIDDYLPVGTEPLPGIPILGTSNAFSSLIALQEIDTVIIANTGIMRERLVNVYSTLDNFQNVEVRLASGLFELLTTGVRVREQAHVPLLVLNKTRITGGQLFMKSLLDATIAAMALLVLLPFFLVLAFLVKRDSPGPVIYRRRVVGQGRQEFDAFKIRTMRIEGDRLLTPEQKHELETHGKLKEDPRVTRIGAFLRRYSLDELPQLINVLRGEMSLIGPRMITIKELEKFGKWQHNLGTVKPGLTGLWQVSGRSDLSYEERVRLDMHYIRNYSIWLDLQILFQTVPVVLFGRGAY